MTSRLKRFFIILSMVLSATGCSAMTDKWRGELNMLSAKLPLVFSFSEDASGIYNGKISGGKITGVFSQRGYIFPLVLMPEKLLSERRPQMRIVISRQINRNKKQLYNYRVLK